MVQEETSGGFSSNASGFGGQGGGVVSMRGIGEALLVGSVLAAVIVAIWEGSYLIMAPRAMRGRTWAQVAVPLLAFWSLDALQVVDVPLGAWLALLAVWNIVEDTPNIYVRVTGDILLGFAAVFAPRDVSTLVSHLWSLGWVVVVALASLIRQREALSVGVAGVLAGCTASVAFSRDPVQDGLISVVAGVWLYAFMRFHKEHQTVVTTHRHQAFTDALTGALTRHGWADWYAQRSDAAQAANVIVAADIDNFKWINDTYGHHAGDIILQQFTARLKNALGTGSEIVRSGGDEFQLWMPGLAEPVAGGVIGRLQRAVTDDAYVIDAGRIRLGVTMGYAVGPLSEETAHAADQALLQAKRMGKNRVAAAGATPAADVKPPSVNLTWLAEAAHTLWATWSQPAALVTATGDLLYHNAAFAPVADGVLGAMPLPERVPWRGWLAVGAEHPASAAVMPVVYQGAVQGYWVALDDPSAAPSPSVLSDTTFSVVFQPIVELGSDAVIGYEALSRPVHPGIPWTPASFFDAAQAQGEAPLADAACLEAVERTLAAIDWPPGQFLFLNISAKILADPVFPVHRDILAARFPNISVVWEVAGRGGAATLAAARAAVNPDASLWALDGLGVGEADLWRLASWPWKWIKLGRTLTSRLPEDPRVRDVVRLLVDWARTAAAEVIAVGIETPEERRAAADVGISLGQGDLWQAPSAWR